MDMNTTISISLADYMHFVDEAWKAAELEAERDALQARVAELEAANKRLADSRDRWKAWWGMQRDTHKKHIDELTVSRRY